MRVPRILSIWQPVGYSTHIISKRVSEKFGVLTSHTGTLDPMAEGVIIILLGEERYKKYDYARWKKGYEFDITFGISTDTFDFLGLITSQDFAEVSKEKLKGILREFIGKYSQKVPPYSAIKVKGKHLFWYARDNTLKKITIPKRHGEIFDIRLKAFNKRNLNKLIDQNLKKLSLVTGDLRQGEIKKCWENFQKKETTKDVFVARIYVEMTKGLYIRSLSQDICKRLETVGFVSRLVRTSNGEYKKNNSLTLDQVFGKNFKDNYSFVSRKK